MASVEILDLVCYCKDSVVIGHQIYKTIWTPFIREILLVNREEDYPHNNHAVTVYFNDYIVGHLPRSISEVSWFFIMHGGRISCEISGHQKFGVGLEVPCKYKYLGTPKFTEKVIVRHIACIHFQHADPSKHYQV